METYRLKRGADGRERVEVRLRGPQLLNHPMYNRSTAFTPEERRDLGLEGLLPDVVSTLEQQAQRAYGNIVRKRDPLERYVGLSALQDRNEHLFFRVLVDHLEEFLTVVHTPTVGLAGQHYSRIFRRARGLWITPQHVGRMSEVLTNATYDDVRLIVVTDNERILGLGDHGAGGMALSQGRLALYVAAAGIHPAQTLPISLDVGTDNRALVEDELYIGWRQPRLRGKAYEAVVDEFVRAVKLRFPKALLQWEDLAPPNAITLLERYRSELPSFNDDVQGTAALVLAGVLAAGRATSTKLAEQRLVVAGAGPAGIGIARLVRRALEREGLAGEALRGAVALLDSDGLLVDSTDEALRELSWPAELATARGLEPGSSLAAVVGALEPTALVGVSGVPGLFGEEAVREMARHVKRPAILPLSGQPEASPADLQAWTDGRAFVAMAAPAEPGEVGARLPRVAAGHSAFVFPGVGLGVLVSEAREVTDGMLAAAAAALAEHTSEEDLGNGTLFPPIRELRAVAARVAEAVVRQATREDVARNPPKEPAAAVAAAMWEPAYPVVEVS
jgi:malic enzyme